MTATEWMPRTLTPLKVSRISSPVAPASSAARMWRRMPASFRCVHAALSAIQISSIHFTGSTPVVHGLFVIRAHRSVHSGSHCANWSIAGPHAPRCRSASTEGVVDELLIGAVLPVSPVRTSSLERVSPRVVVAASLSRRADRRRRCCLGGLPRPRTRLSWARRSWDTRVSRLGSALGRSSGRWSRPGRSEPNCVVRGWGGSAARRQCRGCRAAPVWIRK